MQRISKNRLHNKITALFLAAALAILPLAGCSGKSDNVPPDSGGSGAMGRYVEQQWALPIDAVGVTGVHRRLDGRIAMLLNETFGDQQTSQQRYFSTSNGEDWQEETPDWLVELKKIALDISSIHFNSQGMGAAIYYGDIAGTENGGYQVALIEPDGSLTITLIGHDGTPWGDAPGEAATDGSSFNQLNLRKLQMGEDGLVYGRGFWEVGSFDPATGKLMQDYLWNSSDDAVVGDTFAQLTLKYYADLYGQISLEETALVFFDTATGKQIRAVPADIFSQGGQAVIAADTGGAVYTALSNGLYRLAAGGDTWERLLDGALCSLSTPSMSPNGLIPHGDNEFLILYYSEGPVLMNYVYSPDTPTLPDTELTVYSMVPSPIVSQAAATFRQSHPNVLVNIYTTNDEDSSITGDDARAALNTELLAGKGPDVLLLTSLPMDSYMEKGVLADLSGAIQPLVESGQLYEQVVGALGQIDGKLYAVPTRFVVPTLWGTKDALAPTNSLTQLADYYEANPHKRAMANLSAETLLYQFGRAAQNTFLGKDGQIDVDVLEQLFIDIKRLSDTAENNPLPKYDNDLTFDPDAYLESFDEDSGLFELAYNKADLLVADLDSFWGLAFPNGAVYAALGNRIQQHPWSSTVPDDEVNDIFQALPSPSPGVFYPSGIVGVNAASSNQELATAFVLAMLDEATQSADVGGGFPVNRKAVQHNIDREEDYYVSNFTTDESDGSDMLLEVGSPSHAMRKAFADTFEALETPVIDPLFMMEMIRHEANTYFAGDATALQAAESVRDGFWLRLAE